MRRFVAVDLETTGLDPVQDFIAEVGLAGED
jgi:DNA polymerase III epsilon subunit-like protein